MSVLTFRADSAVEAALAALMSDGIDRSEAIRRAILTAHRQQQNDLIRAEATAVANDPVDQAESRAVRLEMESLRAW